MSAGYRRASGRPRRTRLAALAVAVCAGVAGVVSTSRGPSAAANPSGASPPVLVGGTAANGPVDRFTLASLRSGGASASSATLGAPVGALAMSSTATKAVFGLRSTASTTYIPPSIVVQDMATGTITRTVTRTTPVAIAADPLNPGVVYVLESTSDTGEIDTVDIDSSPPSDTTLAPNTGRIVAPTSMVLSPDASTIYVSGAVGGAPGLEVVPVAAPTSLSPWQFSGQSGRIVDVALSPDGRRLYGVSSGVTPGGAPDNRVFSVGLPITSSNQPVIWQQPLTFGTASLVQLANPTSITVSPDGSTVFVGGNDGNGSSAAPSAVQAFDAPSGAPGPSTQVPLQVSGSSGGIVTIAFSPDGSTLLAAGTDTTSGVAWIYPLSVPSLILGPATSLGSTFGILSGPQQLAVAPDQAPAASFTVYPGPAGTPTSFDASASTVAYGSVTTFAWDFGDGVTETTGSPTANHTYLGAGIYTVTVTETDSAGTTVPPAVAGTAFSVDGPGQTPFRRADPSARAEQTVVITSPGVPPTSPGFPPPRPGVPGGPPPPGQRANPKLVLDPPLGPPGTIVTVSGSGFPPNTLVKVSWSVSAGSVDIRSDAAGKLPPTPLPILVPDVLGPRMAVASGSPKASAPFLVVPASSEPGGRGGSYLFRTEGP